MSRRGEVRSEDKQRRMQDREGCGSQCELSTRACACVCMRVRAQTDKDMHVCLVFYH